MKVVKILNNNAILAEDELGHEYVYLAKGMGFQNKVGTDLVDLEGQKQYKMTSALSGEEEIPSHFPSGDYLEVTARILKLAQETFPQADENILLPLSDHIAFAVSRIQKGENIQNPFAQDIRLLFPEEYAIAIQGAKWVEEVSGLEMNGDEISYIALHIHSAITAEHIELSLKILGVLRDIMEGIQEEKSFFINDQSITYGRFVTHVKFMVSRIYHKEPLHLDMNQYTQENFPYAFEKATLLAHRLEKAMNTPVNSVEDRKSVV